MCPWATTKLSLAALWRGIASTSVQQIKEEEKPRVGTIIQNFMIFKLIILEHRAGRGSLSSLPWGSWRVDMINLSNFTHFLDQVIGLHMDKVSSSGSHRASSLAPSSIHQASSGTEEWCQWRVSKSFKIFYLDWNLLFLSSIWNVLIL